MTTRRYIRLDFRLAPPTLVAAFLGLAVIGIAPEARAFAWFWAQVPAKITEGSRSGAMAVLDRAQREGRWRYGSRANARSVLARWRNEIEAAARQARVSEALLAAVVMVESGGNSGAVSPAGAQGLGQLMPGTARRYGVTNPFDPAQNIRGSAAYLSDLIDLYRGDLVLALAAYNAGEHAVERHGGVPPYAETRAYVPRVLAAFQIAGDFCATPPRSARRNCRLPINLR